MKNLLRISPLFLLLLTGCEDVEGGDGHTHNENEVFTTVILTFSPVGGGDDLEFRFTDLQDGNPVTEDITLANGADYDLATTFVNELEDPAEIMNGEIQDEDEEHQVFFTGSAVEGPATGTNASAVVEHAYVDQDGNGLPLGLENTINTLGDGSGDLIVTLRHMPPENGEAVKVDGLAETVASSGFSAIGGNNDIQVTFPLAVE